MAKVLARKVDRDRVQLDPDGVLAISHVALGDTFEIDLPTASTGSISMLKTWRMWMAQIAKHMADRGSVMPLFPSDPSYGSRPFNADDAHESFTHAMLGCDEHGVRYSWGMGAGKLKAPKSKRLYAMDKLQAFAFKRGIVLKIPVNSEYRKIKDSSC